MSAYRLEVAVFEGVGYFGPKFQVEGDIPANYLCTARYARECLTTLPLKVFTQRNCAAKYTFRGKWSICAFWPLCGLGATYAVHLRLIGKIVVDFLLVIIELFSLGLRAEALRANIVGNHHF